jgi:hypothetical protein
MPKESISKIEVTDANELVLVLESPGDPFYQFVYRQAAGVYWMQSETDLNPRRFGNGPVQIGTLTSWILLDMG